MNDDCNEADVLLAASATRLKAENERLRGHIANLIEAADAARLLLLFAAGPHEAGAVPTMLLEAIEKAKEDKP